MLEIRNVLITIGLLVFAGITGFTLEALIGNGRDYPGAIRGMQGLLIFSTALWAAISSYRLEFRRFKTALSLHPMIIFFANLLLWIVVFPWFLTIRYKIKHKLIDVKRDFQNASNENSLARPLPATLPAAPRTIIPPPLPGARMKGDNAKQASVSAIDQIEKLSSLKDRGILTEEEFTTEKRKLLGI